MNRKTILSSHFPDFAKKWKKFQNQFKKIDSWYIVSDYCLDDKNKPNDVMAFTIYLMSWLEFPTIFADQLPL